MLVIVPPYSSVVPICHNILFLPRLNIVPAKILPTGEYLFERGLAKWDTGYRGFSGSWQTDFPCLMMIPVMKVIVTHPRKEIEVQSPTQVHQILQQLNLTPEAYLVIRGDELVTEDTVLQDSDSIEIRSVISGGSPLYTLPKMFSSRRHQNAQA